MPAKLILLFISLICAIAFFVSIFRRNLQLPAIALVLLVLSSILVGAAWPAILQQFVVGPNANEREAPSISRNIEATRQAFGLTDDKVTVEPYSGTSTATSAAVRSDTSTIPNIRLLDPAKLTKTFTQLQQRRNFYGFPDKLDIDRYDVDNQTQDYVVAARELDSTALVGNQTDWINRHLVYTHGNGFVAAPANKVNAALEDTGGRGGLPEFTVSDTTTKGAIDVTQPRIYYGELIKDYSIVGAEPVPPPASTTPTASSTRTRARAGGSRWGGTSSTGSSSPSTTARSGSCSTTRSTTLKDHLQPGPVGAREGRRALPDARRDPYPAVVDGKIQWIVDGYTTLKQYPYAQQVPLGDATRDSLQAGVQRLPDTDVSYLRNSVKATVDAYDGTVTLYSFDDTDPVLKTWEKVFPGTVQPSSAISPALREHFRYPPEDQFKVQRQLLTRYHVTNPGEFFSTVSFWDVPSDPTVQGNTGSGQEPQPPYYLLAGLPNQNGGATFQLTSALVSLQRQFLAAYMTASSDPETYGKITVLQLPADTQTLGPQQVQAQFLGSPRCRRSSTC